MYLELKENKVHGTKDFPYMDYHVLGIEHPFQIPVHWHNEIEIIYVLRGPFKVIIEGSEYQSKQGDIFIVNPGELHFMGSDLTGADYHTFVFPLDFISFRTDDLLEKGFFAPLRLGQIKMENYIPREYNSPEIRNILDTLIIANKSQDNSKQLSIRILLLSFFSMLMNDELIHTVADEKTNLGKEILTIIQQDYTSQLTLSDIAQKLHMSDKYISRYFKQSFHITVTQYIVHLRMTKAKHLLETTTLPVTEIAYQSGFLDVSYFVRTFSKEVGLSPLKYRKKHLITDTQTSLFH